jgi:hypothetical protein
MESTSYKDPRNIFFVKNGHPEVSQTLCQKSPVTGISPENKKAQKFAWRLPKTRSKGLQEENLKTNSPEKSPELLHLPNRSVSGKTDFTVASGTSRNVGVGYHAPKTSPENFAGKSPETRRTTAGNRRPPPDLRRTVAGPPPDIAGFWPDSRERLERI